MKKKEEVPVEVREAIRRLQRSFRRQKKDDNRNDLSLLVEHLERLFGVEAALVSKFPHFEGGLDHDGIYNLANDYLSTLSGPEEIAFTDQEGNLRKIVYDRGDPNIGIPSGWTIPEESDWEVVPFGYSNMASTLEKSSRAVMSGYITFQDILRGEEYLKIENHDHPETMKEDAEQKFRDIMAAFNVILNNLSSYVRKPKDLEYGEGR